MKTIHTRLTAGHTPVCRHACPDAGPCQMLKAVHHLCTTTVLRGAGGALVLVIYDEFKKLIDANIA